MKKRVLITGSTQGIGYATAKKLVEDGYEVIIHCSKDFNKAINVKNELGAYAAVTADLSSSAEVNSLLDKTGPVDCLILNASHQMKQHWDAITEEELDAHLTVNIKSTIRLIQLYIPSMKEKGYGRIVTLGSTNEHRQHPELPLYSATKCAVLSFIKNVAKDVAKYGITINNVAPGAIATPRNEKELSNSKTYQTICESIPLGRVGNPDEIAKFISFVISDNASYITGEDLVIDGGLCL